MKKTGIVYLAFGEPYLCMALLSAQTARKYNETVPIQIITNVCESPPDGLSYWSKMDVWLYIDDKTDNNRRYKTSIYDYSQYQKTIYLDCDTLVTGSFYPVISFLEYFDLCLRAQTDKQKHKELSVIQILKNGLSVKECPHWNGGALFFNKNCKIKRFFDLWAANFKEIGVPFDQPALAKAIFESDVRVLSLDTRWNGGFKTLTDDLGGIPIVAHYHSAFDRRIEQKMLSYADLLESAGVCGATEEVVNFIRKKSRIRKENEPVKWRVRRLYREFWHRKHDVLVD